MNFCKTAAQFFQNVADYIDPQSAWERTRAQATHDAVQRRKDSLAGSMEYIGFINYYYVTLEQ